MKVLVTGGAGFIGSHIVDRLVIDGYRVRVVDNLSSGRLENLKQWLNSESVELLVGDLREPEVALRAVDGVNVVFHFAANPEVRLSTTDPEVHFTNNIVATFNVLEATMIAWRKSKRDFEVYNVASEDWITVDEVAGIVMEVMELKDVERIYKPILHGVG